MYYLFYLILVRSLDRDNHGSRRCVGCRFLQTESRADSGDRRCHEGSHYMQGFVPAKAAFVIAGIMKTIAAIATIPAAMHI